MSDIAFKKPASSPPAGLVKMMLKMGMKPPAKSMPAYPENWASMSGDEKYAFFKSGLLATENREFVSAEVAEAYVRRVKRLYDVIELKEPDEVPVYLLGAGYAIPFSGLTQKDAFYNGDKIAKAIEAFYKEFEPEYALFPMSMPGEALDFLGVNIMRWPGSSRPDALPDKNPFQYLEREVMKADEYPALINNPEGFIIRNFYARICDNLPELAAMPNMFSAVEPAVGAPLIMSLAGGPMRSAMEKIFKASDMIMLHMVPELMTNARMASTYGPAPWIGGISLAPFDIIGDTMRGTRGLMMDMFRHPDEVVAACEALLPLAIQMGVESAMGSGNPVVFIPLHKGADGFMSDDQFAKFYWPTLKALYEGLIAQGLVPFSFVEGGYNTRLDVMADANLPKGRSLWLFDQTDMKAAKEKIGSWGCIGGNVPSSLFVAGTPEEMDARCKELIETCGPGGGYFLAPGCPSEFSTPENMHTFLASPKKYGVYK